MSLNLTKKPNQRIEYNQYIEIISYFIFHSDEQRLYFNVAERADVYELWRILKGHKKNQVFKHSL